MRIKHLVKPKVCIRILAIAAMFGMLLAMSTPTVLAANACGAQDVQVVQSKNGSGITGQATLVVNTTGAHALMQAENLKPGVAYTVWFIYFDDTSKCLIAHQCGAADLTTPPTAPEGVFGRMDSAVAGDDGELTFQETLRDFEVSAGSALHLVLFAHGTANTTDLQERARQLLTPEAPGLGAPGLGIGAPKGSLVGAAIFEIPACR
jgi:hypothetical protein